MEQIKELKELINKSKNIVFFGGAGVSTESGIPDFRSAQGLYQEKSIIPPEVIISRSYFFHDTKGFYKFYKDKMIYLDAKPNDAHKGLAKLENMGKLTAVITQNIDNLHQLAGSKNVIELHGSVYRNHCLKCHKFYDVNKIMECDLPRCECGGIIKPDVTLYEEQLPNGVLEKAIRYINDADLFIVGGTSLSVYPAASLIYYFPQNRPLVLINRDITGKESLASLFIKGSIGEVFKSLDL
ncbi:MAG: NAD-dependent protein deacylase [Acholeplasmatales bacterium]|jgi:NAD-dependent deacetylase